MPRARVERLVLKAAEMRNRSEQEVAGYRDTPNLIHIVASLKNNGGNLNYLKGHAYATGPYVAHVDGDDFGHPDKFVMQLAALRQDKRLTFCAHAANYVDDMKMMILKTGTLESRSQYTSFDLTDLANWGPIAVHSSFMYKRIELGLNLLNTPFMEWSVAMSCLGSRHKMGIFINKHLINYTMPTHNSRSWSSSAKRKASIYEIQFKDIRKFFSETHLRSFLYAQVLFNFLAQLRSILRISINQAYFLIVYIYWLRSKPLFSVFKIRERLSPKQFLNYSIKT